jgi:hypothetical protein
VSAKDRRRRIPLELQEDPNRTRLQRTRPGAWHLDLSHEDTSETALRRLELVAQPLVGEDTGDEQEGEHE